MFSYKFKYETALMIDSVLVFSKQIGSAVGADMASLFGKNDYSLRRGEIYVNNVKGVDCLYNQSNNQWPLGEIVIEQLKNMHIFNGLSGPIQFDSNGRRTNYIINIYKLTLNATVKKVGTYSDEISGGLVLFDTFYEQKDELTNLKRRDIIISTIKDEPFFMINEEKTGNDRYYGYIVDLTDRISKLVNFSYEFRLVRDNKYGAPSKKLNISNKLIFLSRIISSRCIWYLGWYGG